VEDTEDTSTRARRQIKLLFYNDVSYFLSELYSKLRLQDLQHSFLNCGILLEVEDLIFREHFFLKGPREILFTLRQNSCLRPCLLHEMYGCSFSGMTGPEGGFHWCLEKVSSTFLSQTNVEIVTNHNVL